MVMRAWRISLQEHLLSGGASVLVLRTRRKAVSFRMAGRKRPKQLDLVSQKLPSHLNIFLIEVSWL